MEFTDFSRSPYKGCFLIVSILKLDFTNRTQKNRPFPAASSLAYTKVIVKKLCLPTGLFLKAIIYF